MYGLLRAGDPLAVYLLPRAVLCAKQFGAIMSNRKSVTVSLDADLWRRFQAACALMATQPSTMFEQFMAMWLRKNETKIIEMSTLDEIGK